jgi:iron complex outermembrane receptor protein
MSTRAPAKARYDLEIQDTLSLSDSLRLVSGMNYRYDRADSETYFNGTSTTPPGACSASWNGAPRTLAAAGRRHVRRHPAVGNSLTPRVAVNYLITPRHGLRAVYSEAIRSPDMFENNVNWSYTVKNLSLRPMAVVRRTSSRPAARATSTRNACARASWATTATSATST